MNTYRLTHNAFFLECAYLRHAYGMEVLGLDQVEAWLSENEIEDFTKAYMMGSEI